MNRIRPAPAKGRGGYAVLVRFPDPNGDRWGEGLRLEAPPGGFGRTAAEEYARKLAGGGVHKLTAARKLLANHQISVARFQARKAAG